MAKLGEMSKLLVHSVNEVGNFFSVRLKSANWFYLWKFCTFLLKEVCTFDDLLVFWNKQIDGEQNR